MQPRSNKVDLSNKLLKDRGRQELVHWLNHMGYNSKADRFDRCKDDSIVLECNNCNKMRVIPKTCQISICPQCNEVKRHDVVERYSAILHKLHNPKRLDLTVENLESLNYSKVKELRQSFHRLRDQLPIDGGIYSIEIKNKGNGWNLHMHLIVDMPYIPQEQISNKWEQITGCPIVYVQEVDHKKQALHYITKYVTKAPELLSIKQAAIYVDVLNNKRLLSKFGSLYTENCGDNPLECPNCGCTDWDWLGSAQFLDAIYTFPGQPACNVSDPPPN